MRKNPGLIDAVVREWHAEFGWGVVDSAEPPGGSRVLLDYETGSQDGYDFRAVRIVVPVLAPAKARPDGGSTAAYRSRARIDWDE